MKAMRLVLSQEGLSIPKVAILIGGPDWPTSVSCGIMRLSLPQIILGTTPVVFLILPTCVTGALLYMASLKDESGNPEFSWDDTVSTITVSLTALVQCGSMIVAAYYLEQTADKRVDEVAAIADDLEVFGPKTPPRIHPQWMMTAVRTGRLSCRKPNLQQLPSDAGEMIAISSDRRNSILLLDF